MHKRGVAVVSLLGMTMAAIALGARENKEATCQLDVMAFIGVASAADWDDPAETMNNGWI